jgi:hypothetical protein
MLSDGRPVFDLRIFPVLEAPNLASYLGHLPLKDAFNRFVIGDPEVQLTAELAIVDWPELRSLYRDVDRSTYWLWPLDPDEVTDIGEFDPIQPYITGRVHTPATDRAQALLRKRYKAMINALQTGLLLAVGDPVRSSDKQEILTTIWGGPGYYFDRRTGDLLQDRDWGDQPFETTPMSDGRENYQLRWRAVLLRSPPVHNSSQTGKPSKSTQQKNKFEERYEGCLDFLCRLMRATPHLRPKRKQLIFRDAKVACGENLGWDIFCAAWEAAKRAVPDAADAWSRAGAPKKSYRK